MGEKGVRTERVLFSLQAGALPVHGSFRGAQGALGEGLAGATNAHPDHVYQVDARNYIGTVPHAPLCMFRP